MRAFLRFGVGLEPPRGGHRVSSHPESDRFDVRRIVKHAVGVIGFDTSAFHDHAFRRGCQPSQQLPRTVDRGSVSLRPRFRSRPPLAVSGRSVINLLTMLSEGQR